MADSWIWPWPSQMLPLTRGHSAFGPNVLFIWFTHPSFQECVLHGSKVMI